MAAVDLAIMTVPRALEPFSGGDCLPVTVEDDLAGKSFTASNSLAEPCI